MGFLLGGFPRVLYFSQNSRVDYKPMYGQFVVIVARGRNKRTLRKFVAIVARGRNKRTLRRKGNGSVAKAMANCLFCNSIMHLYPL